MTDDFTIPEPIVIVGVPRSGTSLVAGLFAKHGVWTGKCRPADEHNPTGYFESVAFNKIWSKIHYNQNKKLNSKMKGRLTRKPRSEDESAVDEVLAKFEVGFKEKMLDAIKQEGYKGGHWLVKHDIIFHPAWGEFKPNWIAVRRDETAIMNSFRRVYRSERRILNNSSAWISPCARYLEKFIIDYDASAIWYEHLMNGDFSELGAAMQRCGLKMDERLVRAFIDPSLDHSSLPVELADSSAVVKHIERPIIISRASNRPTISRHHAGISYRTVKGQKIIIRFDRQTVHLS